MKNKLFITFEGIDGSGKSTQSKLLYNKLIANGYKVQHSAEPTTNEIGTIIRKILTHQQVAHPRTIAALFVADRLDHILNENYGMKIFLLHNDIVITDRYYLSSYAYNGLDTDMEWVMNANEKCVAEFKPHIHFFIDIPVDVALDRIQTQRNEIDLYESKEKLTKVRDRYMLAIEKCKASENIIIVDGMQSVEAIEKAIWTAIATF